ncbi:MAG: DNA repair protein RecO [Clostridiales bacterium]|nr:DNA repair protein RecO [Clostridiales bacterium]
MATVTKGLVIKEQTVGESDRLITILTADYGLVRAFVRGAKQIKNRLASSTSLFAYAQFSLYRGREAYTVDSAEPIEVFFELRQDIERLALAQYFAQLAYELGDEDQPCEEMLSVLLNALHLLCMANKDVRIIKSAVELRLLSLGGYMPNILACASCGTYETNVMYFDTLDGCIYCENCGKAGAVLCRKNVITAIRFICLTEPKRIYSFTLDEENLSVLSSVSEKYLISRIQRKLPTLDFYKSLFSSL